MKCLPSPVRLLPVLLALGLAGCATEITYTTKTSDGQKVTFTLINGIANHGKADGLETSVPKIEPDLKQHQILYHAAVLDQSGKGVRSIKLEDVSDEKSFVLIEENNPQLKNMVWIGTSQHFGIDDEPIKWISYLDQSFRVYRYTITRPDGHQVVLYEGVMIPAFAKAMMRGVLGAKY